MGVKYDFGGYATRNDLKCSDGRTIRRDAFKDNDGTVVPIVWQHIHDDPNNVLGHGLLENRADGVYVYGKFNGTPNGQQAKALVDNGDVRSLSIYANRLKQDGGNVLHGVIREVSLVLAGANPGASIESLAIEHSDGSRAILDDEILIRTGENTIEHMDEEPEPVESEEKTELEHADEKNEAEDSKKENEMAENSEKTVGEVFDTLTEEQKTVVYALIGQALEDAGVDVDEGDDEDMKHNVFENDAKEDVLTHADMDAIFTDAKKYGSLKDSFLAHAGDYGIDDIEYLFPDAQNVSNTPDFIQRDMGWVQKVMGSVHHTPFSRIKSIHADITEADARARGYLKGKLKKEEVFALLKRVTLPQTIYKKQKLDRDDVIDITDFDVVAWLKREMRMMLEEEIARAILVGDGRSAASDDKISELNIRPIWTDEDLYTVKATVSVAASATEDDKAKAFIKAIVRSRKNYRGSGNPTLYTTEDMLTSCLLLEDNMGRVIYDTVEKLATAMRVKEIVTVEPMENLSRISGSNTMYLMGILVNLNDYNVGADKGGAVSMFDDFDIDYNQQKYLIETRCSGALTKPFSAVAVEMVYGMVLNTDAEDPDATLLGETVSDLQTNVYVNGDYIEGVLHYITGFTGFSGDAAEQEGNYLALKFEAPAGATTTVELIGGNHGPVTLDSDMNCIFRISNRNQKIKVVSTSGDLSETKVYSLRGLKLESAN